MYYEQITDEEETVMWRTSGASKWAPSRKFPRKEETDTGPEIFAEAPTEGVDNEFHNIKIFDAQWDGVEEGTDVENFSETTSPVAREAAAGNSKTSPVANKTAAGTYNNNNPEKQFLKREAAVQDKQGANALKSPHPEQRIALHGAVQGAHTHKSPDPEQAQ